MANDKDHKSWQEYEYYKKNEWNIISITKKSKSGTIVMAKGGHSTHSEPYFDEWGSVNAKSHNASSTQSTKIEKNAGKAGAQHTVTKVAKVKITKRNSKDNWTTKTVTFYYIKSKDAWVIKDSVNKGTAVVKSFTPDSKDSNNNNSSSEPATFADDYLEPGEDYVEDDLVDALDFEDDTDNSDSDLPHGLIAHRASKFIEKANTAGIEVGELQNILSNLKNMKINGADTFINAFETELVDLGGRAE